MPVALNRLIFDYDQLLICGPVFPHEVVGFSGGNKYLFPGIAGPEIINFTHWLGALITQLRRDRHRLHAGARGDRPRGARWSTGRSRCLALVVTHDGVAGLYFGTPAGRVAGGVGAVGADRTSSRSTGRSRACCR